MRENVESRWVGDLFNYGVIRFFIIPIYFVIIIIISFLIVLVYHIEFGSLSMYKHHDEKNNYLRIYLIMRRITSLKALFSTVP